MKNKTKKIIIIAFVIIAVLSFIIPVKHKQGRWENDSEIYDIGHYLTAYYNIYGIKIIEK